MEKHETTNDPSLKNRRKRKEYYSKNGAGCENRYEKELRYKNRNLNNKQIKIKIGTGKEEELVVETEMPDLTSTSFRCK